MLSTMQEGALTVRAILDYGVSAFGDSQVFTYHGERTQSHTYAEIAARSAQLAHALSELGVKGSDRVGTFCFNHNQHLEAYYAIPSMGAVLHTLNIRLFAEQLAFVINDASDKIIISDAATLPLLAKILNDTPTVERLIVVGKADPGLVSSLSLEVHDYEELIAGRESSYPWPDVEERSAAAMCYTSGTTGNPKGVVYSHRSTFLHSLSVISSNSLGLNKFDRALVIVPMFHANAWGIPYAGFLAGADMIMPTRFLQAQPLVDMINTLKPTVASGVPTIWNDVLRYTESHPVDMSCFRLVSAGGSAVPQVMIEEFRDRFGVNLVQGWGMTETSPLCTVALPPRSAKPEEWIKYQVTAGKAVPGVEIRIRDLNGGVAPNDGTSLGELEVRGPWITAAYFNNPTSDAFDEGWLRTGDMGTIDEEGYLRIVDRTKDVIKSGGEWVSSVDLENALMGHHGVFEAAVVGVPDPRWDERPLACVVKRPGVNVTVDDLRSYLEGRVAKWWVPDQWAFLEEIPKTSVGKFDKKALRASYKEGSLLPKD